MKVKGLVGLVALLLAVQPGWASDPVGIYALIDKVEIEPSEGQSPERIRVWGVFAVSLGRGDEYREPAKGFIYFTLPEGKVDQARKEWNDLKKVAGTKQCVAFTPRGKVLDLKIRTDKDVTKGAVTYPVDFGVTRVPPNQYMAKKLLVYKPKP